MYACRLKSISASGISGYVSLSNISDQSKRYFTDNMKKRCGYTSMSGISNYQECRNQGPPQRGFISYRCGKIL